MIDSTYQAVRLFICDPFVYTAGGFRGQSSLHSYEDILYIPPLHAHPSRWDLEIVPPPLIATLSKLRDVIGPYKLLLCKSRSLRWLKFSPSWTVKTLPRCRSHKVSCRIFTYTWPSGRDQQCVLINLSRKCRSNDAIQIILVACNSSELWVTWSTFRSSLWIISHNLLECFLTRLQCYTTSHFLMTGHS